MPAEVADHFVKFPRTPHLFWLGTGSLRDDKLMEPSEADRLLRLPMSVEEKVDGANLGLSLSAEGRVIAQSRGHYLTAGTGGQWQPLWRWLARHDAALRDGLEGVVAFGEWCYARHTVAYEALPDWFLLFDVYDRSAGRFWTRKHRDSWASEWGLQTVPDLASGRHSRSSLEKLLNSRSHVGRSPVEGVYLRWDDADWLTARAKVVRRGWVMADDEHWSARPLETNQLAAARQEAPVS